MAGKSLPPPGIYVPLLAFFMGDHNGDRDTVSSTHQMKRLVAAGVRGVVVHSITGEAAYHCPGEWKAAIEEAKAALAGTDVALVVGVTAPSQWQTTQQCLDAAKLGADYVMVHAPGVYPLDDADLVRYFTGVGNWSKVPVILCETIGTPAVSVDVVRKCAAHANIVGMASWRPSTPAVLRDINDFAVFCGTAGFATSLGAVHGVMAPLANVAPAALMRVWSAYETGDVEGAQSAVAEVAPAGAVELGGDAVVGLKFALEHYFGFGGTARSPLPLPSAELKARVTTWLDPIMDAEIGARPAGSRGAASAAL